MTTQEPIASILTLLAQLDLLLTQRGDSEALDLLEALTKKIKYLLWSLEMR